MTADLKIPCANAAAIAGSDGTGGIKGIAPVGGSFLRAVEEGVATRDMYAATAGTDGLMDLWFDDGTRTQGVIISCSKCRP